MPASPVVVTSFPSSETEEGNLKKMTATIDINSNTPNSYTRLDSGFDEGYDRSLSVNSEEESPSFPIPITENRVKERDVHDDHLKTLEEQIKVVEYGVEIYFQNRFKEAEEVYLNDPNAEHYMYYKVARAYMGFILAALTMERPALKEANDRVNAVLSYAKKMRKPYSLSSWFGFKPDYNEYTDEEAHAEVVFAEASIMSLLLTFLSDVSFLALIATPFKIRAVHKAYQLALQLGKHKDNWRSDVSRINFMDGLAGWGFCQIIMSHLPERVLRLLALVGYETKREEGFKMCQDITARDETYRAKGVQCLICFYALYISQIFGVGATDLEWVDEISRHALEKSPNSVFDLFFRARIEQIHGRAPEAINLFKRCIDVQNDYTGLHNVSTWDLLWCYAIQGEWRRASDCASFLEKNCNWSKATNLYQWACFQYMIMEEEGKPELMEGILDAMKRVPEYRRRFAGKTIPPEKFAITKAQHFTEGKWGRKLHLPAYELFYMWNIFNNSGGKKELLDPIVSRIDQKIQSLKRDEDENVFVMLLLKGVCLRNYGRHEEAISCFRDILDAEQDIEEVTYVPPHAAMEIGLSLLDVGQVDEAKSWLHKARDDYTGFLVESLAHLRIHGALCQIRYSKCK